MSNTVKPSQGSTSLSPGSFFSGLVSPQASYGYSYFIIGKSEDLVVSCDIATPLLSEITMASEAALAKTWLTAEEDEAWKDL